MSLARTLGGSDTWHAWNIYSADVYHLLQSVYLPTAMVDMFLLFFLEFNGKNMQNDSMYLHLFLCICGTKLGCVSLHLYIHSMRNSASSPADYQTVQCLRSARPRAVWLLLTECHDPEISAFALTGGFEISGLKVLWDYISEGVCHDGPWQVLLSSGWRNSAEHLSFIVWNITYEQKKHTRFSVFFFRSIFLHNKRFCFLTSVL